MADILADFSDLWQSSDHRSWKKPDRTITTLWQPWKDEQGVIEWVSDIIDTRDIAKVKMIENVWPGGAGDGVAAEVLDLHRLTHTDVQRGRVRHLQIKQNRKLVMIKKSEIKKLNYCIFSFLIE